MGTTEHIIRALVGCHGRRRRFFRLALIPLAAALMLGSLDAACATNRAVLVGVSGYRQRPLWGPAHDVAMMYGVLRARGFADADIRVLADQLDYPLSPTRPEVPSDADMRRKLAAIAGLPTRAAIMGAFERLAQESRRGDFVVIYYSGHGSQQPMGATGSPGTIESDGRDDIILPIDVGLWDSAEHTVENAIVDDEIKRFVDRIRDQGAFVWVIVDACHSANMTRDVFDEVYTTRAVAPSDLGVPASLMARLSPQAPGLLRGEDRQSQPGRGGYVGFFGAAKDELAANGRFPLGHADRRPHGMLTFFLTQVMALRPTASFLDLSQMMRAAYQNYERERTWRDKPAATPFFEGDINQSSAVPAMESPGWVAIRLAGYERDLTIFAGALHGLVAGTEVVIRTQDDNRQVARGRLVEVGISRSRVTLPASFDVSLLEKTLIVEPPLPSVSLALGVGFASGATTTASDRAELERVREAVHVLSRNPSTGFAIDLVTGDKAPDVVLTVHDGRLWFLTEHAQSAAVSEPRGVAIGGMAFHPDGVTRWRHSRTPSIPVGKDYAEFELQLRQKLSLVASYRNLSKLSEMLAGAPAGRDLVVELFVLRDQRRSAVTDPGSPVAACTDALFDGIPAEAEPITLGSVKELQHCDRVFMRFENRGSVPIDLKVLYFDADYGISVPRGFGGGMVLKPGDRPQASPLLVLTWSLGATGPLPVGLERLVIVGLLRRTKEGQSYTSSVDDCAQPGLSDPFDPKRERERGQCGRPVGQWRAGVGIGLERLLAEATGGAKTRSASLHESDIEDAFAIVQPLLVVPPR